MRGEDTMDSYLANKFREKVNEYDMVYHLYHDREGKNQWGIICSAMDWLDVVVGEIDISRLGTTNDNQSSVKMMTFISCIDVLWEAVQQLHRVFVSTSTVPFCDDSSVFTDKLYDSSDNEYFKTIRACFSAHPVNLNDRFNGGEKERRYASWSGGGFGHKDFSVMLYSNKLGCETITLDISFSELLAFAQKRYQYLNELIKEIDKQVQHYKNLWRAKTITKSQNSLKQIMILQHENVVRLDNEYYKYELGKLQIIFGCSIRNEKNQNAVNIYRHALQKTIQEFYDNIQEMRISEIASQKVLEPSYPFEYQYAFSKLSEAVYSGNIPYVTPWKSLDEYLSGVVDIRNCDSIGEAYVVAMAGFYLLENCCSVETCERKLTDFS